jgi:hypothetical protein
MQGPDLPVYARRREVVDVRVQVPLSEQGRRMGKHDAPNHTWRISALGLGEARGAADERRKQLKAGTDPTAQRDRERAEQAKADAPIATVCELYIEHVKARGKLSWKTDEGYLNRPKAKFGKRAASSITKRELLDLLEDIARASKSSANRTQSTLRTLWGWAAERDYVPHEFPRWR